MEVPCYINEMYSVRSSIHSLYITDYYSHVTFIKSDNALKFPFRFFTPNAYYTDANGRNP